jgi:hypothetical protein
MSKYDLLVNAKTAAAITTQPQFQAVKPPGPNNPNLPPQSQAFEAVLNGVGNCSASVQLLATNDNPENGTANWIPYGPPIALAATSADLTPGTASVRGDFPWRYFGAYVASISGTNASVTTKMSA